MHYCAALYIEDVHTSVYLFHVKDNPNPKLNKEHRTLLYRIVQTRRSTHRNSTDFEFFFSFFVCHRIFFYVRVVHHCTETIFEKGVEICTTKLPDV